MVAVISEDSFELEELENIIPYSETKIMGSRYAENLEFTERSLQDL